MTYLAPPPLQFIAPPMISVGGVLMPPMFHHGAATPASATWPTANLAYFVPFNLPVTTTIARLYHVNGATASGNVDIGIYDVAGNKIVSSGAAAQSGTNQLQFRDITDTTLSPGQYYLAMSASATTTTMWRTTFTGADNARMLGILTMASAHALPTTATFASATNYVPFMGATTRATP